MNTSGSLADPSQDYAGRVETARDGIDRRSRNLIPKISKRESEAVLPKPLVQRWARRG